jgi:hypothetical protein
MTTEVTNWIDVQDQAELFSLIETHGQSLRARIRGDWEGPIDLRGQCLHSLHLSEAKIHGKFMAQAAHFAGSLIAPNAEFDGEFRLTDNATVGGFVDLCHAKFHDSVSVCTAKIAESLLCASIDAPCGFWAMLAEIGKTAMFNHAKIGSDLMLSDSRCGQVFASHAEIRGGLLMRRTIVEGNVSLLVAKIRLSVDMTEAISGALGVDQAEIGLQLDLTRADIGELHATNARIVHGIDSKGAKIAGVNADRATPEQIERLDLVRARVLENQNCLNMKVWHGDGWKPEAAPGNDCGTTHCIAGWLQVYEEDPDLRGLFASEYVERKFPCIRHIVHTSNSVALKWLEDRRYAN